ncbi:glycosyltransferase family 4 protein [Aureispira anguillae]|uniref:Glycosyltransferase family 4 protein n=1 Tax=Aureispira anguillae TaxID=2864201 RepID=A0A915YIF3_9BACT|nr:glycosyltransferase family 4 protein [Aureispira anguillae]BDS13673.1 glycosyltransferase family 4 protein [Aureispira anguillae]
MKVLYVTHGADMMGANKSLLDLIMGLQAYDVESVLLIPEDGELSEYLTKKGIPYIKAFYYNWAFTKYISKGYWLNNIRQKQNQTHLKAIAEKVRDLNFDLIYSNSSIIGIGAQLADYLTIPHIWRIREFGEKDYGVSFWGGRQMFNKWANKSAAITTISKAIEKETLTEVSAPKYVIFDGIINRKELDSIRPNSCHDKDPFVFLIIGLIHPTKRQLVALRAFHKVHMKNPNTKLLIVGKGRRLYTKKIKNYIKKNGLENAANFVGYTKEPYKYHEQADCVLMCSKSEGMGRVTIEGMIFGNPVIGFNGGATPELVQHNKNGLIYSKGEDELAECMLSLVSDRKKAAEYGRVGRKEAEKYLIEYSSLKEYQLFQEILKKKTAN